MKPKKKAQLRNLLAALIAIHEGMVPADDVVELLKQQKKLLIGPGSSFIEDLATLGDLGLGSVHRLEGQADAVLSTLMSVTRAGGPRDESLSSPRPPPRLMDAASAPIGSERFRDLQEIGRGSMGVVYSAFDTQLHRRVALKLMAPRGREPSPLDEGSPLQTHLPSSIADDRLVFEGYRVRFMREALVLASLPHAGIPAIYETGVTAANVPLYSMRLLSEGNSLHVFMEACRTSHIDLRLEMISPFIDGVKAIAYAHENGVCHRDLKPEHFWIGKGGDVVVIDWGLASVRGNDSDSPGSENWSAIAAADALSAGQTRLAGTLGYMSPEAARGEASTATERGDVFSLGVILYEILVGRKPFTTRSIPAFLEEAKAAEHQPPDHVIPGVPRRLSDLAMRSLRYDASGRPRNASAFLREIEKWESEQGIARRNSARDNPFLAQLVKARRLGQSFHGALKWSQTVPLRHVGQHIDAAKTCLQEMLGMTKEDPRVAIYIPQIEKVTETLSELAARYRRNWFARGFVLSGLLVVLLSTLGATALFQWSGGTLDHAPPGPVHERPTGSPSAVDGRQRTDMQPTAPPISASDRTRR